MFSYDGFLKLDNALRAGYRLIGLNLLWCAVTLAGLGVLGIGPASYALARYLDRWLRHGETPPLLPTFWQSVRHRTARSVLTGVLLVAAGTVVLTNVVAGSTWEIRAVNLVALGLLLVVGGYVFPLMAASDIASVPRLLAGALAVGLGSLPWTLLGAATVTAATWALWHVSPAVVALAGVSLPALATALLSRVVFRPLSAAGAEPARAPLPESTSSPSAHR